MLINTRSLFSLSCSLELSFAETIFVDKGRGVITFGKQVITYKSSFLKSCPVIWVGHSWLVLPWSPCPLCLEHVWPRSFHGFVPFFKCLLLGNIFPEHFPQEGSSFSPFPVPDQCLLWTGHSGIDLCHSPATLEDAFCIPSAFTMPGMQRAFDNIWNEWIRVGFVTDLRLLIVFCKSNLLS